MRKTQIKKRSNLVSFEKLDPRQMMSSVPPIIPTPTPPPPKPAALVIEGTGSGDTIKLWQQMNNVYVNFNGKVTSTPNYLVSSVAVHGNGGVDTIDCSGMTRAVEIEGGGSSNTLIGGQGNDTIYAGDSSGQSSNGDFFPGVIDGQGGNDYIVGTRFAQSSLTGGTGNDSITGGQGPDNIDAGSGNDYVWAGDGSNTVYGGTGNDLIVGGADNDFVYAGDNNDTVYGQAGQDYILGEGGNDSLEGGTGADNLYGGEGNDTMAGGMGLANDYLFGGGGTDTATYYLRAENLTLNLDGKQNDGAVALGEKDWIGDDVENITGGSSNDAIDGNAKANVLNGDSGNDTIYGAAGADSIFGDTGADVLYGADGDDKLDGGSGNDALYGGHDNDTLAGGIGDDTLVSIGGDKDYLDPGVSTEDMLWMGAEDTYNNAVKSRDYGDIHQVNNFFGNQSTELDGQLISDPSKIGAPVDTHWTNAFNDLPLFKGDPKMTDVVQGQLGTCWMLSGLAAIAKTDPMIIKRNLVALGDGSYAARLYFNDKWNVIRVDGDLPAIWNKGNEQLAFAQSGNGTLWAPILEKALATRYSGYQAAAGGTPWGLFDHFDLWHDTATVMWHAESTIASWMRSWIQAGGAVTASTDIGFLGTSVPGLHVYTVLGVSADLKTVTVRNPWGTDDKGFEQGANDGIESMSMSEFDDDFFFVTVSSLGTA